MAEIQGVGHLQIPLEDIILATNNFSRNNYIGEGGFGKVYRGQLPHSIGAIELGTSVAVKMLDVKIDGLGQGRREFLNEIFMLASYKHENIVSLVGFCDEGDATILVYRLEVNGSLDKHVATTNLTCEQRLRICVDVARGLQYLHVGVGVGHRVVHRDLKSSNILLDENWKGKISDFGLCKIGPTNQELTFLVTQAAETLGYIDPQYQKTGILTKESDVYSLGIVFFEVLCGRLAYIENFDDERTFISGYVKHSSKGGTLDSIVMPSLRDQMKSYPLHTFLRIAYECLNKDRKKRPTIGRIVLELQAALEHQFGTQTMLWGSSSGGHPWTFMLDNNQRLKKITINHMNWIRSIAFTTELADGTVHSSELYGQANNSGHGEISEVNFDVDEEIIGISGTTGHTYDGHELIMSLCFVTNKKNVGPFGRESTITFSETWEIGSFTGFYGRCGWDLDGIGCCLKGDI